MERNGKRKKLAVAFKDEKAAWIEGEARSRRSKQDFVASEATIVREAVQAALEKASDKGDT